MSCFKFLKAMMFIFNGIIFAAGAAILGVGIWVKVDNGSLLNFLGNIKNAPAELTQVLNVGYLLIAIGLALLVIGFLGCCGAARESKCMLMLFFIIVLIIFIAEVVGAIVVLAFKSLVKDFIDTVGKEVVKSIKGVYGRDEDFTTVLNTTMYGLECCGFYSYRDFNNSVFVTQTNQYPEICCGTSPCSADVVQTSNVTGCFPRLVDLVEENIGVLGGVALGIAALEVCAMTVAMILFCKIGK